MKNKNVFKFGLALLTTLALVACNSNNSKPSSSPTSSSGGNNQPASSVNSEPSSQQGGESSNPQSDPESSDPANSSAPESSEPVQSSEPASQPSESEDSSEPDDSSTNPWGGWTGWDTSVPGGQGGEGGENTQPNIQPQPQPDVFSVTAFEFEKDTNNKVSLVVRGTLDDSFEGTFTWAWGLATNDNNPVFVVGSAEPEATAFQAVTVTEKAFEVKLNLSDIQGLQAGNYRVYGGNPDSYGRINPVDETSTARDGSFKYYITSYNQSIVLQELPPVALEEAVVYKPGTDLPAGKQEGIYVKLGGTVKAGVNVDDLTVRYDFQNIRGNTRHPSSGQNPSEDEYFWTKDDANGKAYLNLYIGFMAAGERWATHLGFNVTGNTIPNCFMAVDIEDVPYTFVDENKVYTVNAKESEGQSGTYWGCLGFAVTQEHEEQQQNPDPDPNQGQQTQPIITDPHTWVLGTPGVNSDDKVINNYSCSDTDCNAVAAGIAFSDHNADDDPDIVSASGQIKKSGVIHWKIVAPKAGACKLFMASKLSSNWETYASQRTENNGDIAFDSTGYAISAGSTAGVVTMAGKFYQADFGFNLNDYVYYEVGTLTVESGENLITFETPANQSFRLCYGGEVRLVFED